MNYGEKAKYQHFVPKVKEVPEWYKMFKFVLIEDLKTLQDLADTIKKNRYFMSFDTETSSLDPEEGSEIGIVGYSFCFDGKTAYYVAVNHHIDKYNLGDESLDIVYDMLCGADRVFMYNARFDTRWMEYQGFNKDLHKNRFMFIKYDMSKVTLFDVANSCWLADTNIPMPTLKDSSLHFLGYRMQTFDEVSKGVENFYYINPEDCFFYASSDALCTYLLVGATMKYVQEAKFSGKVDNSVLYPLMHYENEKIFLDTELLPRMVVECQQRLDMLESDVYNAVGYVFKLNSPAQVSDALSRLGIDTGERTKTGYMKTGIDVLNNLPSEVKQQFPALQKYIEFKSLYKFLSSYVKVLDKIASTKGYARCSYKTTQVPTGRLASGKDRKNTFFSEYNIQSSPKPHPMLYYVLDMGDRNFFDRKENIVMGFKFVPVQYDENREIIDGNTLFDNFMYLAEGFDPKGNVRSAFLPRLNEDDNDDDWIFCSIDFSGQELRIVSNFSHEPVWVKAFQEGGDIHKECYSLDTEILTPTGFKTYDEIGIDDLIAQYNPDSECVEWVKAGHIYWNETDTMYHFKGTHTDLLVTPNHRMWTKGRDNWYIQKAEDVYKRKNFKTICSPDIPISDDYPKVIHIPSSSKSDELHIPIEDFVEMLGYIFTDGGTSLKASGVKTIYMSQSEVKGSVLKKIQDLNSRLGGLFKESVEYIKGKEYKISGKLCIARGDFHRFEVARSELYNYVVENFGGPLKPSRYLPAWFKSLPKYLHDIFLQAFLDGDGSVDKRQGRTSKTLYISSKKLCDDMQVICMGLGYSTCIEFKPTVNDTELYRMTLVPNRRVISVSNTKSEMLKYPDKVKSFCFAVPSGLLVVRRNNKVSVCGNTAYNVWGAENYDKEKRKMAKAANFAVIYGAEAMSFVGNGKTEDRPEGMTIMEAEEFYNNYKKGLPTLFSYQNKLIRVCRQRGTVNTFFGRPRRVKFYFENRQIGFGKRTILNNPIQGCLPYKTKILTTEGYLPIGSVYDRYIEDSGNFNLEVWDGFKFCTFVPLDRGVCDIWQVTFENNKSLDMDSRHKVKVLTPEGVEWKNTLDLQVGDLVCHSINQLIDCGVRVDTLTGRAGKNIYKLPITFDREDIKFLAYLYGVILGDGNIDIQKNRITLTFGKSKYKFIPLYQEFGNKKGINVRISTKTHTLPSGKVSERKIVSLDCTPLVDALVQLVGISENHNCYTKRLADKVYTLDSELRLLILKGLQDTDGDNSNGSIHLANENLIHDLQLLVRMSGFESSITYTGTNSKGDPNCRLNIHDLKDSYVNYLLNLDIFNIRDFENISRDNFMSISEYHIQKARDLGNDILTGVATITESDKVIWKRIIDGGSCRLATFRNILNKLGCSLEEDYNYFRIKSIKPLGYSENTYTLSVMSQYNQFDSEGIISKNTAGDVLKIVMCKLWKSVLNNPEYSNDVAFKCTVHDEINYGIRKEKANSIARTLEETMIFNIAEWAVPLTVEVSFGWSWGSIFDYVWDDTMKHYVPKKA